MATQSIAAELNPAGVHGARTESAGSVLADYWELTKPEINFLIAITAGAGFWMGTTATLRTFAWVPFVHALAGTMLVASGAATLNQLIEVPHDARMRRTARRPPGSGRIGPAQARSFGVVLSAFGVAYLAVSIGALAAFLAALTLVLYLLVYTPLKRVTPLCTLVGAIPGAAPPLIGWAAARGRLDLGAWALF